MTAFFKAKMENKDLDIKDLSDHLIICGWDRLGVVILNELQAIKDVWRKGIVIVSETEEDIFENISYENRKRLFHVKKDYSKFNVLESVGAKEAKSAIVLADKGYDLKDQDRDAKTVLAALTLEKLNPEIFTTAELLDGQNATHLKIAGVEEILSRTEITAGLFATTTVNRGIGNFVKDILTHREGSYLKKIVLPEDYIGKTYQDIFEDFKRDFESIVVTIDSKIENGKYESHTNPPHDYKLQEGDLITIILKKDSEICNLADA